MKKTENISLGGYAFTIEYDAYLELEEYIGSIRNAFSNDPSADEIVTDIEERIAELLKEKCISGMVVNLAMVDEVRKRVGDPKTLAQEGEDEKPEPDIAKEESKPSKKNWKNKRLYRNMDGRILGGVCSGLSIYFGIDKALFRIFFLLAFFIGFADEGFFCVSAIAYICLWIAMPAARSVEQKREMKGRPTNLDEYRSKDFDLGKEINEVSESPAGKSFRRAGGIFLGLILLIIGLSGMLLCVVIPSMPALAQHVIADEFMMFDNAQIFAQMLIESWWIFFIMLGIFFVWFLYNGVMLIFDLKSPSWRPGLVLFIAWIISVFVCIGWAIRIAAESLPTVI